MDSRTQKLMDKLIAEKEAEEQKEAKNAKPLTPGAEAGHRDFLKRWTRNGKKRICCAGGNFWMAGSDRNHCTILRPVDLVQLVAAGVIRKVGGDYEYIPEN